MSFSLRPITLGEHHDIAHYADLSCRHCGATQSPQETANDPLMWRSEEHGIECDACREMRRDWPLEQAEDAKEDRQQRGERGDDALVSSSWVPTCQPCLRALCACCKDPETAGAYLVFSSFAPKSMGKVCESCNDDYSDDHFESGDF